MAFGIKKKNLFVGLVTFCIGAVSATFLTPVVPPKLAPTAFGPPVPAWDRSCRWASSDRWEEIHHIRRELRRIKKALNSAISEEQRISLLEQEIGLRIRLRSLELENEGNPVRFEPDGTTKLVYRQVCDER